MNVILQSNGTLVPQNDYDFSLEAWNYMAKKKNRIIDDYNRARISMVLMQPITMKAYEYHSTLANL